MSRKLRPHITRLLTLDPEKMSTHDRYAIQEVLESVVDGVEEMNVEKWGHEVYLYLMEERKGD